MQAYQMSDHYSTASAQDAIHGGQVKRASDKVMNKLQGDDYLGGYPPLEDDDSTRICFSGEFPVVLPPSTEGFDDEFLSSLGGYGNKYS